MADVRVLFSGGALHAFYVFFSSASFLPLASFPGARLPRQTPLSGIHWNRAQS